MKIPWRFLGGMGLGWLGESTLSGCTLGSDYHGKNTKHSFINLHQVPLPSKEEQKRVPIQSLCRYRYEKNLLEKERTVLHQSVFPSCTSQPLDPMENNICPNPHGRDPAMQK